MKRQVIKADIRPIVVKADGTITTEYTPEEREFFQRWQATTTATEKDKVESHRVRKKVRALMKQCWFNARKVILNVDEYAEASYVEGWVVSPEGSIYEHGWVVQNGKVIDPTLPDLDLTYLGGLEFKGRKGIEEFLETPLGKKHKKDPFLCAFGWGGQNSPGYMKAFEDARALSVRIVQERKSEKKKALRRKFEALSFSGLSQVGKQLSSSHLIHDDDKKRPARDIVYRLIDEGNWDTWHDLEELFEGIE
jgi:hypothetical protein